MNFILLIFFLIFTHCLKGHKISSGRSSPLLESYGCLQRNNITLFIPFLRDDAMISSIDLLTGLEDPCFSMFLFAHYSRKIVQWNGNGNDVDFDSRFKELNDFEIIEFIESLYEQQVEKDAATKQILLIAHYGGMNEKVLNAIGLLDRETEWNVIVTCSFDCLNCNVFQHLPVNRIMPITSKRGIKKRLKSIVKNPDFNENEFLKYIKLDNVNLACLANKTVHVFMVLPSVELLQNTVLIVNNTQGISTQIILYISNHEAERFWTYYIEKNGWKNIINIVFQRNTKFLPQRNTAEVYLIPDPTEQRYADLFTSEDFCSPGRKSFVFYEFKSSTANSTNWNNNMHQACRKNFERVSLKNLNRDEFFENFTEEVVTASCF